MTAAYSDDPLPTGSHPVPGTWAQQAACRFEDPDLFFPPDEERGRYTVLRETLAKRVCLGCPVLGECTTYALATDERYGVWGGLTPPDHTGCAAADPPDHTGCAAADPPDHTGGAPDPGGIGLFGVNRAYRQQPGCPLAASRGLARVMRQRQGVSPGSVALRAVHARPL